MSSAASEKGFTALSKLQHLQEFLFFAGDSFHHFHINANNYFQCLQYLPKLRFAGAKYLRELPLDLVSCLGRATAGRLLSAQKPHTLGLEEVVLCGVESIPDGILLPNLKYLHLARPCGNFTPDSRVSELGLYDINFEILNQAGRHLKTLHLTVMESVQLDSVLRLCPTLEHLSVIFRPQCLQMASRLRPDDIRHLQVLHLKRSGVPRGEHMIDTDVLMQLLQAPELRHLKLQRISLRPSEEEKIVRRLQHRDILQKLESAVLKSDDNLLMFTGDGRAGFDPFNLAHGHLELKVKVLEMLSAMVLCCPKLINVSN